MNENGGDVEEPQMEEGDHTTGYEGLDPKTLVSLIHQKEKETELAGSTLLRNFTFHLEFGKMLLEKNQELTDSHHKMETQFQEMEEKYAQMQSELRKKQQMENTISENEELKERMITDFEKLKQEYEENRVSQSMVMTFQKKSQDLQTQIEDLFSQLRAHEIREDELNRRIRISENELATLKKQHNASEKLLTDLQVELGTANQKNFDLEKQLIESLANEANTNQNYVRLTEEVVGLKSANTQLQQKLEELIEENKQLKLQEEANAVNLKKLTEFELPATELSIQELVESPIKMKGSSLFEELEEHVASKVREELKDFENSLGEAAPTPENLRHRQLEKTGSAEWLSFFTDMDSLTSSSATKSLICKLSDEKLVEFRNILKKLVVEYNKRLIDSLEEREVLKTKVDQSLRLLKEQLAAKQPAKKTKRKLLGFFSSAK